MKKRFRTGFSTLILTVLLTMFMIIGVSPIIHSREVSVSARISESTCPLDQEVTAEIVLSWRGGESAVSFLPEEISFNNMDIVGSTVNNRVRLENGQPLNERIFKYSFRGRELGMGYLEPVVFAYKVEGQSEAVTLLTQRMGIKFTPSTSTEELNNINSWLMVGLIVALAMGVLIWLYYRQRKKTETPVIVTSDSEKIMTRVEELSQQLLKNRCRGAAGEILACFGLILKVKPSVDSIMESLSERDLLSNSSRIREVLNICQEAHFTGESIDLSVAREGLATIKTLISNMEVLNDGKQ